MRFGYFQESIFVSIHKIMPPASVNVYVNKTRRHIISSGIYFNCIFSRHMPFPHFRDPAVFYQ